MSRPAFKPPERVAWCLRARWRGVEGYLQVLRDYPTVGFRAEPGDVPVAEPSALRARLLELAPRSSILGEVEFLCEPCSAWHRLETLCGALPPAEVAAPAEERRAAAPARPAARARKRARCVECRSLTCRGGRHCRGRADVAAFAAAAPQLPPAPALAPPPAPPAPRPAAPAPQPLPRLVPVVRVVPAAPKEDARLGEAYAALWALLRCVYQRLLTVRPLDRGLVPPGTHVTWFSRGVKRSGVVVVYVPGGIAPLDVWPEDEMPPPRVGGWNRWKAGGRPSTARRDPGYVVRVRESRLSTFDTYYIAPAAVLETTWTGQES